MTGVTKIISATWNHHLAGAGEEESFLNRRSPLLLQSGEVVQAVAVSHLEIWIDYNLLTIVGIFKSMFIQIIWRWSPCLSPPPRAWWCVWRPCRRPCPCWSSTCSGSTSGWTRPGSGVSPRLCWDVLCLISLCSVVSGSFGGISPCLDRRQIPRQQSAAFSQPRSPPQTDRYLCKVIWNVIIKSKQLTMLIVVDATLEDGEKTSNESLIFTQSLRGAWVWSKITPRDQDPAKEAKSSKNSPGVTFST